MHLQFSVKAAVLISCKMSHIIDHVISEVAN